MNIAEASIRFRTVTLVLTALVVVLGIKSYFELPRLEDPEFTIKDALVITNYPGATAEEVADEVTDVIERAAQKLGQILRVTSRSERGRSTVTVTIRDQYGKDELPQVWDELRRKVSDAQHELPPGAGPSLVVDDFGDVFGIFYAITGPDYSMAELNEVAKMLRRELLMVPEVKKVEIFARQQEAIYVEISRERSALLGLSPEQIHAVLREHNLVAPAGALDVGEMRFAIQTGGAPTSVESLDDLIIRQAGESGELVRLGDLATIRRAYVDPPTTILRYDGQPAVGLGISTVSGGNVVRMGAAVERRVAELASVIPLGVELHKISFQADTVTESINDFVLNLATSVVIVIVVLLAAMGLRSGLLIGSILMISIAGTFLVMQASGLILERISLGALIIALVMLVDNAIVITEGMLIAIQRGVDRLKAAKDIVRQTSIPLLGSTLIAVLAFGAIGLSDDKTGEYCRSLFDVLLISLLISWVTAITVTPLFCYLFLRAKPTSNGAPTDPYAGPVYRFYRHVLVFCMTHRWGTVVAMIALLAGAIFGFRFVENSFFPNSTRTQFLIDAWAPAGTRLDATAAQAAKMEQYLLGVDGVENVTTCVGQGTLRFLLTYAPERFDPAFIQFIVDVDDHRSIDRILPQVQQQLSRDFPDALVIGKRFLLGPGEGGRIQIRFSGPDTAVLRSLSDQAMEILRADGGAKGVRIDAREEIPVVKPQFAEAPARLAGITRTDLGAALESFFSGRRIGIYREGDELIPIIARAPEGERRDPAAIQDVQIFSPVAGTGIPIRQVVSGFDTELEEPIIMRRNRQPTITVHADQTSGLASALFDRIRPQIEAIALPPGYRMEWGGEHEDSSQAKAALAGTLPVFVLLMVVIVVCLFNCLRATLIIWLTVPLSIIGVVVGLLVFDKPFGFMALLGALSLSGMLIKNGIVLLDEINAQLKAGTPPWDAVVQAAVSRVRPVLMAVLTTVFGLIPLIPDVFFGAMAVTIVVGLLFASVLTLIVVPVLYVIFFNCRPAAT
ncbi:MAG: efflux RND transporter permease subunit [Terrimicrobiaceae bacterium]|nr:efflux RND transporter permease subunit [Terrimicrobiaceae bacterium]